MTDIQELIRAVTEADSPGRMVAAVQKLAAAKDPVAIPTLIASFGYNNPGAAVVAVAGLTELGEVAVPQLLENIDDYNYGARAYSIRTLAAIGDPRALEVLLTASATDFAPTVRRAAAKGLGFLQWHKLAESDKPGTACAKGNRTTSQIRAMEALISLTQDSDWSIRYAAIVGLQALAKIPELQSSIEARFEEMLASDGEKAIRARVQVAQQQVKSL
ncbi:MULTISPECIES: HEAT repeat domain-containing protein [Nostocales]|uniref:HEAT repeat domain-containing protein n=3 Tax=Nostocales TaxID=1161 RepID=A0A0C1N209_9CYAN|nr:HEAT repeat domain-containing protein [Tolypothrix bouteillei]KAF3883881.1 HEAT repeat domain-containing protein [Tolypothrix bouteillei VB521301]